MQLSRFPVFTSSRFLFFNGVVEIEDFLYSPAHLHSSLLRPPTQKSLTIQIRLAPCHKSGVVAMSIELKR